MNPTATSRRQFLGAAAAGLVIPGSALAQAGQENPSQIRFPRTNGLVNYAPDFNLPIEIQSGTPSEEAIAKALKDDRKLIMRALTAQERRSLTRLNRLSGDGRSVLVPVDQDLLATTAGKTNYALVASLDPFHASDTWRKHPDALLVQTDFDALSPLIRHTFAHGLSFTVQDSLIRTAKQQYEAKIQQDLTRRGAPRP